MRTIKFRGVDSYNGKVVYGYYCKPFGTDEALDTPQGVVFIKAGSAEQLIAVDVKGKEVYEGDKVARLGTDRVFAANFSDYDGILDGEIVKV
ncbi:MAG: hypothetical protein IKN16_01380 [Selenomonadaceae bacterium]|nr:hypothetical protein [Selenomonadaceae bacterium]